MPEASRRHTFASLFKTRFTGYITAVLILVSCTAPEPQRELPAEKPAAAEIPPPDTAAAVRAYPLLRDSNAEEFLMEYFHANPERTIKLTTRLGVVKFRLFDDTPLHTANFLMLVKRGYFNNTEFTRVIEGFVVQGGNNENETEHLKRMLIGTYLLSPEMRDAHIHRRGALAAARQYENNPGKKSSPYNFYFVDGRKFNDPQIMAIEREHNMKVPDWRRKIYETEGGAPHLDGEHTVFGMIYQGWDVLDKMARVPTDEADWPREPLIMEMEVINE